ncbi:uncharacterized protein LOC126909113 [Daktulosphaira vitifoliae]|uniref:uncharacterized protein LOC126909113 n=1 Tax=Daktulosphaira vitifoliae TaxID=58002 RepID=UPI0021AA8DD0|nr:uncharacterized protein LOC126909113 [Daktulosphaira vitifoliae]
MENEADEVKNNNENYPYRIEFEDTYFKAVAEAEKVLNPIIQQGLVQTAQNTGTTSTQSTINLAALNIPTFSGKYEDWSAFFDMFQRLVHFNAEITPVQKFFYLKSSLNGEAASSIRCIETTDANYEAAWTTLIERYNNKKVLVQRHVRNIVELEPLQDSTARRLRMLIDDLNGNMKALETLGEKPGDWGPLLLHIVCSKLDRETLKSWEIKSSKDKVPTVKELTTFLGERFQIMESIESSQCSNNYLSTVDRKSSFIKHANNHRKLMTRSNTLITTAIKCYVCNQPHTICKCPSFIALSVAERISKVNTIDLCKICLRKHDKIKCFGRYCLKCNNSHNTLLHLIKSVVFNRPETQTENISSETATTISTTAHVSNTLDQVLLATALVQVSNSIGQTSVARVLLDSASMNNFITVELANSLRLKRQKINHIVCGIGQTTQSISSTVELKIKSRNSDFQLFTRLLVVPKITGDLPMKKIGDDKNTPAGVFLADPLYNVPQPVDILIGASHFINLIGKKQFKIANKGLIYQETEFGFVVSGAIPSTSMPNKSTACVVSVEDSINGGVCSEV